MPLNKKGPVHNQTPRFPESDHDLEEESTTRTPRPAPNTTPTQSFDSNKASATSSSRSQASRADHFFEPSTVTDDDDCDDDDGWETEASEHDDGGMRSARGLRPLPGHNLVPTRFDGTGNENQPGNETHRPRRPMPYSPYEQNFGYGSYAGSYNNHAPGSDPYLPNPYSGHQEPYSPHPYPNNAPPPPSHPMSYQPMANVTPFPDQHQQYALPAYMRQFLVSSTPYQANLPTAPPPAAAATTPTAEVDDKKLQLEAQLKVLQYQEQKNIERDNQRKLREQIVIDTSMKFEPLLSDEELELVRLQAEVEKHQAEARMLDNERSRIERMAEETRDRDRARASAQRDGGEIRAIEAAESQRRDEGGTPLSSEPTSNSDLVQMYQSLAKKEGQSELVQYFGDGGRPGQKRQLPGEGDWSQVISRREAEGDRSTIQMLELERKLLKLQHTVLLESERRIRAENALHNLSKRRIQSFGQKASSFPKGAAPRKRAVLKGSSSDTLVNELGATSEDDEDGEDGKIERDNVDGDEDGDDEDDDQQIEYESAEDAEPILLSNWRNQQDHYEPSSASTLGSKEVPPEVPEAPRRAVPSTSDEDEGDARVAWGVRYPPSHSIPQQETMQRPEEQYIERRMRMELRVFREELVDPILKTLLVGLSEARSGGPMRMLPPTASPLQGTRLPALPNSNNNTEGEQKEGPSPLPQSSATFSLKSHLQKLLS